MTTIDDFDEEISILNGSDIPTLQISKLENELENELEKEVNDHLELFEENNPKLERRYNKLKRKFKKIKKELLRLKNDDSQNTDSKLRKENKELKAENISLEKRVDKLKNKYKGILAVITSKDKIITEYEDVIYDNSSPTKAIKSNYGTVMTYPEDNDSLVNLLSKNGVYQLHVIKLFSKFVKPDSVIIDIGANIGALTLAFAKIMPTCHIHAFEIMPKTFKALQATVKANDLKNVTVHNIGLYSKDTTIGVNYKPYMLGHTAIIDEDDDIELVNQVVECTTLDSFNFKNVSFIKMDIQGAEYDALLGAKETLKNNPKCTVLAEFTRREDMTQDNNIKFDKTLKYMKSLGFHMVNKIKKEHIFRMKK